MARTSQPDGDQPRPGEAAGSPADSGQLTLLPGLRYVWRNLSGLLLWSLALAAVLVGQVRWWELLSQGRLESPGAEAAAKPWLGGMLYVPLGAIAVLGVVFLLAMGPWIADPVLRARIRVWGLVLTLFAVILSVLVTMVYTMGYQMLF